MRFQQFYLSLTCRACYLNMLKFQRGFAFNKFSPAPWRQEGLGSLNWQESERSIYSQKETDILNELLIALKVSLFSILYVSADRVHWGLWRREQCTQIAISRQLLTLHILMVHS